MTDWTASELASLDEVSEIRVAGRRDDGSLSPLVIVWQVVVDGALYVRSVRGDDGKWYRAVATRMEGAISWGGRTRDVHFVRDADHDDAIDDAYFAKYGRGASSQAITSATATSTTLRVEPAA